MSAEPGGNAAAAGGMSPASGDGYGASAEMSFDGAPVPVRPGQTVGAALMAAGIVSWRRTRSGGRPRGLFCGIGICFDCLITIDGEPDQRACLAAARPGMRLESGRSGVTA